MAPLKKTAAAEPYHVPSLAEASPEYAALIAKRQELEQTYSKLNTEHSKLLEEITAAKAAGGQRLSPGVAALLGDEPADSITELSKQLSDVVAAMSNIEDAREVLYRRTGEARDKASKVVCDMVRQEYQHRLGVLCDAARALEAARQHHDELLDWLDVEDINKNYLPVIQPHFMGDRRDGKVSYFLREVKEKGHNV